jgi:hypothetical protein
LEFPVLRVTCRRVVGAGDGEAFDRLRIVRAGFERLANAMHADKEKPAVWRVML